MDGQRWTGVGRGGQKWVEMEEWGRVSRCGQG